MIHRGDVLRLNRSTIALENVDGRSSTNIIPEGATVEVTNAHGSEAYMVDTITKAGRSRSLR